MIINIRGTGGSGKSWVVKQLMRRFPTSPYDKQALGHTINGNTFVLGPYMTGLSTEGTGVVNRKMTQDELQSIVTFRAGGGLDDGPHELRRQAAVQSAVQSAVQAAVQAAVPNVLFEGLLVSGIYGRWRDLALSHPDYRWVFLNTPLEQCIANTRARRVAAGKPPDFNPTATEDKYRSVRSILHKARADRLKVWDVSSTEAVDLIAGWIG